MEVRLYSRDKHKDQRDYMRDDGRLFLRDESFSSTNLIRVDLLQGKLIVTHLTNYWNKCRHFKEKGTFHRIGTRTIQYNCQYSHSQLLEPPDAT